MGEAVDLLASLGNHEGKSLVLLYLDSHPGYHTSSQMGTGFNKFLGTEAPWHTDPSVPFGYCENSLDPTGQVVREEVEGLRGPTPAYAISQTGHEIGVPLAGLLLDWGLRYPDISVQQIFGQTSSRNSDSRAPQHRSEVLMELLTANTPNVANTDMVHVSHSSEDYRMHLANIDNAVRGLEAVGLVSVKRAFQENDRRFRIISADRPNTGSPRGPITDALYTYLEHCSSQGIREFTQEEVRLFVTDRLKGLDISPVKIRHHLRVILDADRRVAKGKVYSPLPGIQRLDNSFNQARFTKIQIAEKHRQALDDLLNIVIGVSERDKTYMANGKQLAERILANKQSVQTIIGKARDFSAASQRLPFAVSAQRVTQLFEAATEPLDSAAVLERYKERYHRVVNNRSMAIILRRMVSLGLLTTEQRSIDSSRTRLRAYYSPIAGESSAQPIVEDDSSDRTPHG